MNTQSHSPQQHGPEIQASQSPVDHALSANDLAAEFHQEGQVEPLSVRTACKPDDGTAGKRCSKFKKGHSGNPRGRPRKPVTHGTELERAFRRDVTISQQGKPKKVPFITAFLMRMQQAAMAGDMKAAELLFRYCPESVLFERDVDQGNKREYFQLVLHKLSPSALEEFRLAAKAVAEAYPQLSPRPLRRRRKAA